MSLNTSSQQQFTGGECLEVEDLVVTVRERRILKGASLRYCGGNVFLIIGRNGSGKSTLLRTIAGLLTPERGRILYGGRDYTREPPWVRRFAYASTPFPLIANKTVRQTLESIAKISSSKSPEAEVLEVAKRYEIESLLERMPHQLSQGERQRVGVAAIVLAKPRLALFDEPLAHLSKTWALAISAEITRLAREERVPAIVSTPTINDAFFFGGDTLAGVMNDGRVVAVDYLSSLVSRPRHIDVLLGLDFYTTNIVDLRDSNPLAQHISGLCDSSARYAWASPQSVEIASDGGAEGAVERVVLEAGFLVAYVRVGGRVVAARVSDSSPPRVGDRVRVLFREAVCFEDSGRLAG